MARLSLLQRDFAAQPGTLPQRASGTGRRLSGGEELPVKQHQSLKKRCASFASAVSVLDPDALTWRQREVAELRSAGLTLEQIGARLGISAERVRQIEARLKTWALIRARKL